MFDVDDNEEDDDDDDDNNNDGDSNDDEEGEDADDAIIDGVDNEGNNDVGFFEASLAVRGRCCFPCGTPASALGTVTFPFPLELLFTLLLLVFFVLGGGAVGGWPP